MKDEWEEAGDGEQRSEVGGQRSGIGRRETGIREAEIRGQRSADFDQPVSLQQQGFDSGQKRFKPCEEGSPTRIADTDPDDGWRHAALSEA